MAQLREACRITAARWAVILSRKVEGWEISTSAGMVKNQVKCLAEFLAAPDVSAWMNGAASVGRNRWRQVPAGMSVLNCTQVHLFPVQGGQAAILVGSDSMKRDNTAWWRVISLGVAAVEQEKALRKQAEQETSLFGKDLKYAIANENSGSR